MSARGLRLRAHHDLGGYGDGMQVLRHGDALYVGHTGTTGAGTSILDVSDVDKPALVAQWPAPPYSHTHKVQVADGLLLTNHELFPYRSTPDGPHSAGLAVYDLAEPLEPRRIGFWSSGGAGVHRIVWTGGRYAHLSATPAGAADRIWVVLDLADPAHPVEVARWSWPWETTPGERYAAHHALVADECAYLGYDDGGLVVLDVADWTAPVAIGRCSWAGGSTHTCLPLPGRDLLVVTDEQVHAGPHGPRRRIHLVDVADPARPVYLRPLPDPEGDFADRPLRFGPHNLHENRPGSYVSDRVVVATWFSAGVRVYDLSDVDDPREVAHWVAEPPPGQPVAQANDLYVEESGLIWVTDRVAGGLDLLEPEPELADLMKGDTHG